MPHARLASRWHANGLANLDGCLHHGANDTPSMLMQALPGNGSRLLPKGTFSLTVPAGNDAAVARPRRSTMRRSIDPPIWSDRD